MTKWNATWRKRHERKICKSFGAWFMTRVHGACTKWLLHSTKTRHLFGCVKCFGSDEWTFGRTMSIAHAHVCTDMCHILLFFIWREKSHQLMFFCRFFTSSICFTHTHAKKKVCHLPYVFFFVVVASNCSSGIWRLLSNSVFAGAQIGRNDWIGIYRRWWQLHDAVAE